MAGQCHLKFELNQLLLCLKQSNLWCKPMRSFCLLEVHAESFKFINDTYCEILQCVSMRIAGA